GVYAGQQVYPAGTPCTSDSQCTTGVGDKCSVDEGLCLRGASPAAHLTCPKLGGHTSTTFRTTALDLHNRLRRELANGQTKNKTGLLPTGKNIYKLDYDCEHERTTLASFNCSAASGYYWNTREMTETELLALWKQNIQKLWDDVTLYGVDKDITPHANISQTWQWLATDRTTKLGCAMLRCPVLADGKYKVFIQCTPGAGYESALPAYTPGPLCQKDTDCTLMPKSVCLVDEGLCRSEAVYPAPGVRNMCPSASNRLDDAARLRLLDLHNHHRSQLIHGREAMGNAKTFAPTGSNMYKMVWDCAAEAKSQAWIEDAVGRIPHSTPAYRNYSGDQYGESLYWGPSNRPVRDAVEWAINWWWGELAEVGWYGAGNHTLTLADLENTDQHETSAAWAKTFKLGCGVSKAGANVCCQYGPG
ncbi:two-domain VAP-2 protein precursor, partial [Aphelenchoides avenae]